MPRWLPCNHSPLAHLLCHRGVGDHYEGLGAEGEAEHAAVHTEEVVQRHKHRLPHNLADVACGLGHLQGRRSAPYLAELSQEVRYRAA